MVDRSWNGSNGNYLDGTNWTPSGVPLPGETDAILSGNPFVSTATLDGYTLQLGDANNSPTLTVTDVTFGRTLVVTDIGLSAGYTLSVVGTLTNNGNIVAAGQSAVVTTQDTAAAAQLTNTALGQITATNNASLSLNNAIVENDGVIAISGGAIAQIGLGGVATALTGNGSIFLATGGSLEDFGTAASTVTVTFQDGAADTLILDTAGQFAAAITGFAGANRIQLTTIDPTGAVGQYDQTSQILTVNDAQGVTVAQLHIEGAYSTDSFVLVAAASGTDTIISLACYVAGTSVETAHGARAVELVGPGDALVLIDPAGGAPRLGTVRWVGRREVDVADHARPDMVAPVRITRGAIAEDVPTADVLVSPDHALWVDGRLIPARLLINGRSIVSERGSRRVTYVHVEVEGHALMLAAGMPAETYLDVGDRHGFADDQARDPSDSVSAYRERGVAPLCLDAASVGPIWHRLDARAEALGIAPVPAIAAPIESAVEPHLLIDGHSIRPMLRTETRLIFAVPPSRAARMAVLSSAARAPSEMRGFDNDRRRLGLPISAILVSGPDAVWPLALDDQRLRAGWHGMETAGETAWRWTDGTASLPIHAGAALVEVRLNGGAGG